MRTKIQSFFKPKHLLGLISRNKGYIFCFFLLGILFLTSTFHEKYPDEFDNIAGGNFINNGVFPYSGFFTHHSPFAYFFASVLLWFSGVSFVKFRIVLALFYLIYHILFCIYVRRKFLIPKDVLVLIWSLYVALISTYMWGHMFLADSFSALMLTPAYILLFLTLWQRKKLTLKDVALVAALLSCGLLTSVTYIFVAAIGYLALLLICLRQLSWRPFNRFIFTSLVLCALPYVIFGIYLLVTRSASDFYYQAIFFNKEYYVTLADGSKVNNPLRYTIVIFATFMENFRLTLVQAKDFNLSNPFSVTFAIANAVCLIALLMQKRWSNALLLVGFMIYVNVRSNPLNTSVTDYQSAAYHYLSVFNGIFILHVLWQAIKTDIEKHTIFIYKFLFMLLSIYSLFFTLAMFNSWFDKVYSKYMGKTPLIYDRPELAPVLNTVLKPDEFYYIGPFAFEEHFYTRGKLASKYFITIPAMDKAEKVQNELKVDFERNKPPLIVFDDEYVIFNTFPGKFLEPYLNEQYTTLSKLRAERTDFSYDEKTFGTYELGTEFFIRKDDTDLMLARFKEANLIR